MSNELFHLYLRILVVETSNNILYHICEVFTVPSVTYAEISWNFSRDINKNVQQKGVFKGK